MDDAGNGGGRQLALLLVIAILLLELVLTKKASTIWGAIWSGPYGLGHQYDGVPGGGSSPSPTQQIIHLPNIKIPNQPPY